MSTALWVLGVAIFEETMELAAGHVEGALLIFGRAAGDERSALVIEGCAHHPVDRHAYVGFCATTLI